MNRKTRVLGIAAIALALAGAALGTYAIAKPAEVVIKVVAKRFDYTPNVIKLKKGVPVTLELTTKDVIMGFSAPDFATRADIVPGKTARVRFVPDKTGTFTFVCDIFCGTGHEQMDGTIEVVD